MKRALIELITIDDDRAFDRLAGEWNELLLRSYDNRIFFRPDWLRIWWSHFGRGQPYVLTCRESEASLEAVLPLQVVDGALSLVGDPEVVDYMDGACVKQRADQVLSLLWRHAFECLDFDTIELRHVPSSSVLISALEQVCAERGLECIVTRDETCPVAILCSNWDGYLALLSKKQRHEVRRKLRRLQENHQCQWRTASDQRELERDLTVFLKLHRAARPDKAVFMDSDMQAFFEDVADRFMSERTLRLSILHRDAKDIAAVFGFQYRRRYSLYNSGYDPLQSADSPGVVAAALAMKSAMEEGAIAFDFLSGDEPFKYQLGATSTYTSRIHVALR